MHTAIKLAQLGWTGHVIRMPDKPLPKKVFLWRITDGKTLSRWPEDRLKASLKNLDIPMGSL